jgi:hypothetical protein
MSGGLSTACDLEIDDLPDINELSTRVRKATN